MIKSMRFLKDELSGRLTRFIIWSVLPIGLLVTLLIAVQIKESADRFVEQDFITWCSETHGILVNRLDDHARILQSGAVLFNASKTVTRDEWCAFTQSLKVEKQLPGIQGFGFSLLIRRSELSQHIQEIRKEGFPEYLVHPEGERDVYSSIIYLEPFTGRNLRAFGYDMFSEPVRRSAMERARDTDAAALSGKVVLVQETDQDVQAGSLMYVPVYRKGLPTTTVEQRRVAIVGWVYSPYRMKDLLQGILGGNKVEKKPFRFLAIFDGESILPQNLLFGQTPVEHNVRFKRQIPIMFNGHRWTLCVAQIGGGWFTKSYTDVWLILLGGTLCTLLLYALFNVLQDTQADAQKLAKTMTANLRESEESLRQTTDRLTLAVRAGGVGIWDYDVVNNRLVWDDQMYHLYGITSDQFSGAYDAWQAGLHPEDRERGDAEIQMALNGEKEFDTEFRVLWPNGTIHSIRALAVVKRDAEGRLLRMIGTNWDITEQERYLAALQANELTNIELQKSLIQSRDAAQEATRAKGLFLATMSHEIRTPLNAILGYAQIMERECQACPSGKRLNAITRSGEHLLKLITDLLELVRGDVRTIIIVPNNFDFYKVLEDVRAMFVRRTEDMGLTLKISYTPDTPRFIYTDQSKVRQIIVNLVGNAFKFTEKGGVNLLVSAIPSGATDGIMITVDVEDTGCGIQENELDSIFDLFNTTSSNKISKGTGLGLPLSRRYAQALGGDITVTSSIGVGSRFRVTFKASIVAVADQQLQANVLRIAPDQQAYRLLLVDDDFANNEMLSIMLTAVGFAVITVSSAEQALYQLRQTDGIDLVLMDKNMPLMNGYEAIGHIRELSGKRKLPILIVTASGFADENEKALAAGADGHVSKPVRREKLLKEIERVIGVRYTYEPILATANSITELNSLDPTVLAHVLPAEQRFLLDQTLRRGDIRQIRNMIEIISRKNAKIAVSLSRFVDIYDYDGLHRLLADAKGKTV